MEQISRRRFLKISAATFGAGAVGSQIPAVPSFAMGSKPPRRQGRDDRHLLRNVLLEVRRHRARPRREALEVRGQSPRPDEQGTPVPARHGRRRHALRPGPHLQAPHPDRRAGQGGVQGRHLGRGAQPRRGEDEEDRRRARPRVDRPVEARHGLALLRARDARLRLRQQGRALVRAVPRPARHRLPPHLRHGAGLARTHRHRQHELPRPHRHAPGREHAQHAGAGVRAGRGPQGHHHRGRPALLRGREQGEVLAAHQARHRHGARARVDERPRDRRPLRQGVRGEIRPRLRQVRRRDQGQHARVGRSRDGHPGRDDPRHRPRDGQGAARRPRAPGPARQLVRRRRAARALHGPPQRAPGQLGPQGRALPPGRHEGRGLPLPEVPRGRRSPRSTTPTASGRSRTRKSPRACARPRSPASPTRSRAGSCTPRTCCRRCPTRRRRSRRSRSSTCWWWWTRTRARSPATPTWSSRTPCSSSATTTSTSAGDGRAGRRCASRSSRPRASRSPPGGSPSSWPTGWASASTCPSRTWTSTSRSAARRAASTTRSSARKAS